MKIPAPLSELLEEGIIDDVHRQLLSGKEASVYVVSRDEMLIAAKVYKARNNRTFKNVTSYVDGRNQTRNTRDKRAKQKKTKYGRELLEESWRSMEHDALQRAFQGGVRVPEPYLLSGDVLLMEYLCDDDGEVAPRLADIDVPFEVATLLHEEVFQQVRRLLAAGLIHGDLSAFNVLVAPGGLTLIDLPQVVDASANSEAKELLCRDLRNITEFFARYDARLLDYLDCGEALWEHFRRGTLDRAEKPEKARSKPRGGRGRRGRAGDGGLGARAEKHANRPRRRDDGGRDDGGRRADGAQARPDGRNKDKPPRRRGDSPTPDAKPTKRRPRGGNRSGTADQARGEGASESRPGRRQGGGDRGQGSGAQRDGESKREPRNRRGRSNQARSEQAGSDSSRPDRPRSENSRSDGARSESSSRRTGDDDKRGRRPESGNGPRRSGGGRNENTSAPKPRESGGRAGSESNEESAKPRRRRRPRADRSSD